MKKIAQIAVLVETSRGHGRQIIEGVARYAAEHGAWSLRLEPRNIDDTPPSWLKTWAGEGIIVRCDSTRMAKAVIATGLPTIDVRGGAPKASLPLVGVDNERIIDAAITHFQERGFRYFGWCDLFGDKYSWMSVRRNRFLNRISEAGMSCSLFPFPKKASQNTGWSQREMTELTSWLTALPRPVAILACDDEHAHFVLDAARRLGLRIPEEAAVLGIDNDDLYCRVSSPPLSSVDVNAVAVGYQAAEALEQLMRGKTVPARTLIAPRGIVTRQSTDVTAVEDSDAATALRYIRDNARKAITAEDVANYLAVSRSTLDRSLRATVGRSATVAIMQARLAIVKADLTETDLTLSQIADRCNFRSVQHLANLFRERVGMTAGNYRKEMRH
ncbi:XylR family transcriptional regulator [Aporhodopirellula aestuarii]|uniref:XylR family transcriptional regulator n=1 Tax=Aporhodopirellula aestuarii TaxID=2950107 RepID=A0ABT0UB78_9BACT|nr:XylR family transcriptional regulator [Aporhodopirellula aestuarii]MCM2374160.1 XylR family transcriptional regulator [Aporhodopirellula aestuarii]